MNEQGQKMAGMMEQNNNSFLLVIKAKLQGSHVCLLVIGLLAVFLNLSGCAPHSESKIAGADSVETYAQIEEQWGILPESVRYSADGYILDFRYRVTDPEKAVKILAKPKLKPYMIDQESGLRLPVPNPPKVGPLVQKTLTPESGRIYFSLFSNPGKQVKIGDKVTVVMDELKIANLTVQ